MPTHPKHTDHKAAAKQQHQITPGRVSHSPAQREVKTESERARTHGKDVKHDK
jgi:hypothetical protein